ncbi:MAG: hypothetical protein HYV90_00080 [Candidatus Woesebacteria bacterium]|nr:MAG: hypothetical protein HYV90_00080 [Candidatus Woesebacteria bacterium]
MERDKNKSHLNLELTNALSSWQKMPDSKEYLARVSEAITVALATEGLLLKVKREVLDKFGTSELPIIRTVAFRHGCVDGYSIVFESSPELSMRVGAIRERSYLFLDSRTEKTIGFFRPEDILELKTK